MPRSGKKVPGRKWPCWRRKSTPTRPNEKRNESVCDEPYVGLAVRIVPMVFLHPALPPRQVPFPSRRRRRPGEVKEVVVVERVMRCFPLVHGPPREGSPVEEGPPRRVQAFLRVLRALSPIPRPMYRSLLVEGRLGSKNDYTQSCTNTIHR